MKAAESIVVENLPVPRWRASWTNPQPRELENIWVPAYYRLVTGDTEPEWCVKSTVLSGDYFVPFDTVTDAKGEYQILFKSPANGEHVSYQGCCQEFFCK
jgi:hypothetical protein